MTDLNISDLLDDDDFRGDLDRLAEEHRQRRAAGPKVDPRTRQVRAELEYFRPYILTTIPLDELAESRRELGQGSIQKTRDGIAARLRLSHWAERISATGEPIVVDSQDARIFPRPAQNLDPQRQQAREELARVMSFAAPARAPEAEAEEVATPMEAARSNVRRLVGGM